MSEEKHKIRVGLIFGGRSAEHEVSLNSAKSVAAALDPEKYDITLIGITLEGNWLYLGERGTSEVNPARLMAEATVGALPVTIVGDPTVNGLATIEQTATGLAVSPGKTLTSGLDVVIPVLHGPYGEDGTLQGLLEMANVPYVGPGVLASAVGMDKVAQRELFRSAGISVIDYVAFKRRDWDKPEKKASILAELEEKIGYPCFVKPVNMGSSVGIGRATDKSELTNAIDNAARYDRKIMVEKGVRPRELEVAVLGNDEPIASVVGELAHSAEFYDYKAKYIDSQGMQFFIPAQIPEELSDRIRTLAIKAYLTLDCAGMTRVDFFQDKDSGQLFLNEVNTIPGFTSLSMYPMMWEASGLSYPQLVDRLVELAIERHADKNRNEVKPG
ncbi:MAG: D-alanine--D-alanine ligase [Chloroflexi bacterium]|uniref:D-alanine--D-alanine ligase n=1 Tax=Candidatus Chlorohelix allophototropha TaxID=3003348 RepID=A0A8T7LYG1_9CHLR|nr:D-alanine--D-alanine ligase [Chloroflexota bacterium]WJW66362.1 D-alanine--D-alanine ligase [Chloroflexota bacterium L227-S17]